MAKLHGNETTAQMYCSLHHVQYSLTAYPFPGGNLSILTYLDEFMTASTAIQGN